MKKVEKRTTPDLLQLTLQLHSRALNQPNNKEMHEAYVEARQELEKRLPISTKHNVIIVLLLLIFILFTSYILVFMNIQADISYSNLNEFKDMTNRGYL